MVDDVHRVLLLSIPKTGCTAWRWTIYNSIFQPNTTLQDGQKIKYIHDTYYLKDKGFRDFSSLSETEKEHLFGRYFNILSVRHPLDRLESCYIDKIVNYKQVSPSYRVGVLHHKQKIEGGSLTSKLDLNTNVTFEDFLSFVLVASNEHWNSVERLALPCQMNYT